MAASEFFLQNATAYNASVLTGTVKAVSNDGIVWVWFTPTGSYDGTVNFEISPNGGTNWFPTQASATGTVATLVTTVASPVAATSYFVHVPAFCNFRARMSGGTQGALTIKGKYTLFSFATST